VGIDIPFVTDKKKIPAKKREKKGKYRQQDIEQKHSFSKVIAVVLHVLLSLLSAVREKMLLAKPYACVVVCSLRQNDLIELSARLEDALCMPESAYQIKLILQWIFYLFVPLAE
jgi:hypothetical protein